MERRRFTRVPFETEVEVIYGDRWLKAQRLKDISLKGLYIVSRESPPVGSPCLVKVRLTGAEPPIELKFTGEVVRHGPDGFAIVVLETDLESFSHLRKLLSYNFEDPEKIEAEISRLLNGPASFK
ncbi:PilZ domain-containing protein [Thermosulfuriphilus sp.]